MRLKKIITAVCILTAFIVSTVSANALTFSCPTARKSPNFSCRITEKDGDYTSPKSGEGHLYGTWRTAELIGDALGVAKINDFLKGQEQEFVIKYMSDLEYDADCWSDSSSIMTPGLNYNRNISFDGVFGNYASFSEYNTVTHSFAAHPWKLSAGYVFDITTGKRVSVYDMFIDSKADTEKFLFDWIAEKLPNWIVEISGGQPCPLEEQPYYYTVGDPKSASGQAKLREYFDPYSGFTLSEEGIRLSYECETIATSAYNDIGVLLPWSALTVEMPTETTTATSEVTTAETTVTTVTTAFMPPVSVTKDKNNTRVVQIVCAVAIVVASGVGAGVVLYSKTKKENINGNS